MDLDETLISCCSVNDNPTRIIQRVSGDTSCQVFNFYFYRSNKINRQHLKSDHTPLNF